MAVSPSRRIRLLWQRTGYAIAPIAIARAANTAQPTFSPPVKERLFLLAVVGLPATLGVLLLANVALDIFNTRAIHTRITDKYTSIFSHKRRYKSEKTRTRTCYLKVETPQVYGNPLAFRVPCSIYKGVHKGEPVSITYHPGALGLPWYLEVKKPGS